MPFQSSLSKLMPTILFRILQIVIAAIFAVIKCVQGLFNARAVYRTAVISTIMGDLTTKIFFC
jgi:hypothetical protein